MNSRPHSSTARRNGKILGGKRRWPIAFTLMLMAGLLAPVFMSGASQATEAPTELAYACAKKQNGQMRAVDSLSQCGKKEVRVTVKPGPIALCVQPGGSVRLDSLISRCRPPATRITVPPQSGAEYFCAAIPSGVLRYASGPDACGADEVPLQVTPNDDAPTVVSATPEDAATHVATNTDVTVTFSEPITAANGAVSLVCGGNGVPAAVLGSPGTTLTIDPDSALAEGAECDVTLSANGITDVDTLDPPNNLASDYEFSFTTDVAPAVNWTTPADGATNVGTGSDLVVNFSEPVNVTAASFMVDCDGSPFAGGFAVSGSGTSTATINPTGPLPAGISCTVTVIAAEVLDVDGGDPPDHPASNYALTFTTVDSAPTVVSTSPANGATDVDPDSNIELTFSEPISVESAAAYHLECDAVPQGYTVLNLTGTTITIDPANQFPTGVTCAFTVFGAAVSDSDVVDPPNTMANDYAFAFTVASNDPPTEITLAPASIDEGNAVGDVVGELDAVDPDAGDAFTYALVSGTGSDDNGAFTIDGDELKADEVFDFETKSSYSIRVEATDTAGATFQKQLTVTVADVDEAPAAGADSYSGVVGNTQAVLGTTGTGPHVVLTGDVLTANDTDPEGGSVSAVAETVATTGGGTATINANGSFTYLPGVGDKSQTDSFTYQVTDGSLTASATVSVAIGADLVWYVDGDASGGGDGRSSSPLNSLTSLNGAGGAGDADAAGDTIFGYAATGSYAGGLRLENNQGLVGERYGLTVAGNTLVAATATAPVITNAAGNGLDLANGSIVHGVAVSGASADGINGSGITTSTVGDTVTVASSTADGVDLSGAAAGNIEVSASVSSSGGRSVVVSGRSGGTTTFSGAISGPGVVLSSNTGATVAFTGALALSSGAQPAFSATGGGTVTASNTASTLTSTTGTALVVENTTIGSAGLRFTSISANGAVNGIRLNATGSAGGLSVLGGGNTTQGGNASGGTIQNTTGAGISLTNTSSVSLNNVTVSGTPNAAGIDGTGVSGFSFTNGTVTGSGSVSKTASDSNIAFNDTGITGANVSGAVTVSNSVLGSAYGSGVDVRNIAGTISALNVTGNAITSPTAAVDSFGSGVLVLAQGTLTTAASINGGSISNNSITGYPGGSGVVLRGGNSTAPGVPGATVGSSGTPLTIDDNTIQGASALNPMAGNCVRVALDGRGSGVVNVTNNGTAPAPLRYVSGDCVSVQARGEATLRSSITGNDLSPQVTGTGSSGIYGEANELIMGNFQTLDDATLSVSVENNNISQTSGDGIFLIARAKGAVNSTVVNNFVGAPTGSFRNGIYLASGTASAPVGNASFCSQISGNTAAGSGASSGIGLDKLGTDPNVNAFGIAGLTPSPASSSQASVYVAAQNPASTGVVEVLDINGFVSCTPAL